MVISKVILYLSTQRLQCSSFLVMTCFLLRDYNIPKKELHSSPWVSTPGWLYVDPYPGWAGSCLAVGQAGAYEPEMGRV